MFEFRLKFHWILFLWVQLTIFQHWFRQWLGVVQGTSHYLNQLWLVYWHIYAWHGLNELIWITKHENVFAFSFIIHHSDCVNSWYPTPWTIGPIYPVKANIPQSIQTSVPQGFNTLDKIPEILHTFLRHFFHIFHFESIFAWFYFHVGLINNNLSVVGEMTWHWTGDKPSLKPLMTQFTVSLSHMSRVCFIFVFWSKL